LRHWRILCGEASCAALTAKICWFGTGETVSNIVTGGFAPYPGAGAGGLGDAASDGPYQQLSPRRGTDLPGGRMGQSLQQVLAGPFNTLAAWLDEIERERSAAGTKEKSSKALRVRKRKARS